MVSPAEPTTTANDEEAGAVLRTGVQYELSGCMPHENALLDGIVTWQGRKIIGQPGIDVRAVRRVQRRQGVVCSGDPRRGC